MIHTLKRKKQLAVVAQIEALMASVPAKRECPICHELYQVGHTPHPCVRRYVALR